MGKKRLEYDDDMLVELIAEGQLTYKAIGERVGISGELVKKIAQGGGGGNWEGGCGMPRMGC